MRFAVAGIALFALLMQSQSQLKAIYKDNADTIVGNCDTTLFLGGKEKTTLKEIIGDFRQGNDIGGKRKRNTAVLQRSMSRAGGLSRNSDSMADRRGTGEATLPLRCLAAATPL